MSEQPSVLASLVSALRGGSIEVVDLTSPLSASTPVIQLPPEFGQTAGFELEEISRYDDRGPGWYWNNFRSGEHTGTHFDAPNHWVTGKGLADVAQRAQLPYDFVDTPGMLSLHTRAGDKSPVELSAEILATLRQRAEDSFDDDLYGADPEEVLTLVRELPDDLRSAMVVGHNPTVQTLSRSLSPLREEEVLSGAVGHGFPTCALAVYSFDVDRWAGVAEGAGSLVTVLAPPY